MYTSLGVQINAAPWTYDEWWEVSHEFTVSSDVYTRFAVEPSTLLYYITWLKLFAQSFSGNDFSVVIRNSSPELDLPKCQPC